MRNICLLLFVLLSVCLFSCKKTDDGQNADSCGGGTTTRVLLNQKLSVGFVGGEYYLYEANAIDSRLRPCFLAPEFRVDKLIVTLNGEVKLTKQIGVCCTDDLNITKISR